MDFFFKIKYRSEEKGFFYVNKHNKFIEGFSDIFSKENFTSVYIFPPIYYSIKNLSDCLFIKFNI